MQQVGRWKKFVPIWNPAGEWILRERSASQPLSLGRRRFDLPVRTSALNQPGPAFGGARTPPEHPKQVDAGLIPEVKQVRRNGGDKTGQITRAT